MPPAGGQTTARSRRAARRRTPTQRKPPAPTPTQIRSGLAQQAAYVSQGHAVERVANRQRAAQAIRRAQARSRPLAATPMRHPQAGRPVRTQAHVNQVVAAVNRQSRSVAADRAEIVRQVQAASQTGGNFTSRQLRAGAVKEVSHTGGNFPEHAGLAGSLKRAAQNPSIQRSTSGPMGSGLPFHLAADMFRAAVESPRVITRIPGDIAKYAVGAPAGLTETIAHPNQALTSGVSDYVRRYGPLLAGDDKAVVARLKKEGITPELVDAVGAVGGAGAITGRIAQRTAESGALGARALRIATERPNLRISGNVSREQEVSSNLWRNVVRAGVDARRKTVQTRRAAQEDAPLEVRLAQERGEVTYTSRRRQGREQRQQVAREKGAEVQRLKMVQQREHAAAVKNLNSLSKDERRGFAFAHQFGATSVDAAKALIRRRLADIEQHRARKAAENPSYTVSKRRDQTDELQWLHDNAEKVFTPNLRRVVKDEQAREVRVSRSDPGVNAEQAELRRHQPLAIALGLEGRKLTDRQVAIQALVDRGATPGERAAAEAAFERVPGETGEEWMHRVQAEARAQGLERPGYLHSEERPRGVFATMAVGGSKATNIPKPYSGSLLRQGIESMDPEVHLQGVARGLKRRQQWNMVARNLERHAVDTLGGKQMRGRDIVGLTRDLENAGVDLGSVAFWNPRKFFAESRRAARDTEGASPGEVGAEEVHHGASDVHTALQRSIVSPAEVRGNPEAFTNARGFSVVPAAVLKEIEGSVRPEGLASRIVDVSRGKISRVLLGNPAWLTFQVASNALLSGLAGVGPIDAIKAQQWWKGLSDAEKEAMAPEVGVHGWYDEQTRLGATANNRMVNGYRAFKQTGMYQLAHKANPLDAIFKADNAQNNFFRKAVFYNQAKREAYRRMGDNATRMIRAQQGINRVLKMDPKERITAAAKDPKVFEHHARAVRDFLGDYTSYTSRERARLGRYAMFYGFLRHSLRMTFYTLPVKHPLMTAIGLELGKMHDDELRKIFGVPPPIWEQANAYIKVGGKTRKFAIGRLNPFFNAVQFQGPGSLTQLATPLAGIAMDQLAAKNVGFDRPWTVGGSGSYVERGSDVSKTQRAKIALAEALHLSPYVRLAEKTGIPGVSRPLVGRQTDESSLLFPDPVQYKQGAAGARNAARVAEQQRVSPGQNLLETLLPVIGTNAGPTIRSSRDFAAGQGNVAPGPAAPVDPADLHEIQQSVRGGQRLSQEDLNEIRRQVLGG